MTRRKENPSNRAGMDPSAQRLPFRPGRLSCFSPCSTRRKRRGRQHRREVYIPLTSDTEFLTLLASALNSLATLQLAQKRQFTESVQMLAREVSAVSSPSRPKSDLYIWREIFALWIEAEIFESSRERDRGERTIEDVEKHLEWFVDQVAKRKLAKRMKHKESRVALEKFIALNVELLDLKKFQIANEEAARKIVGQRSPPLHVLITDGLLTRSHGFPAQKTRQAHCPHRVTRLPQVDRQRLVQRDLHRAHLARRRRRPITPSLDAAWFPVASAHLALDLHVDSASCHPDHRRLRMPHLRRHRLQTDPLELRTSLLW